jgi:hypothetical protein
MKYRQFKKILINLDLKNNYNIKKTKNDLHYYSL